MRHLPSARQTVVIVLILALGLVATASARPLRLFVIGNSFSKNATQYLPDLAAGGGHELIIGRAQAGGCSLERHWNAVAAWQADPADPAGRIYGGKSLAKHLGASGWDVITIQQYSLHSPNPATYRPFAANLHAHLRKVQPAAEILIHQTWAYRVDAARFGQIGPGRQAANQREMWEHSRAAYRTVARELGARVIPSGDAFWRVDSDPQWGFQRDANFDPASARFPALPPQTHSLHVGDRWNDKRELKKDTHHASPAGKYLAALVWYGVLFNESPEPLTFVPPGMPSAFTAHLRTVAWQTVQDSGSK
jgi:hypothetical protein